MSERLTRSTVVFDVGSRVITGVGAGKKGVVSFVGETQFAAGEWIGLTLDNPDGKNDGSLGGVSYFNCKPMHGVFIKRAQVKLDKDAPSASSVDPKDKLAALREKRRAREAGASTSSTSTAAAGSSHVKTVSSASVLKGGGSSVSVAKEAAAKSLTLKDITEESLASPVSPKTLRGTSSLKVAGESSPSSPISPKTPKSTSSLKGAIEESPVSCVSSKTPITGYKKHEEFEEITEDFMEDNPMKAERNTTIASPISIIGSPKFTEENPMKIQSFGSDDAPDNLTKDNEIPKDAKDPKESKESSEIEGDAWSKHVSDLIANLNAAKEEKELQAKEMNSMKASLGTLTTQLTISNDERDGLKQQLITAVEQENTQKKETENAQKKELEKENALKMKENTVAKSRESDLENQVNELMDTLEILTLDKEQLVMDNELLQAQLDESKSKETASASSGQAGLAEENTKLREALRRLHSQSTSDKNQLDLLNDKNEREEKELKGLREYQLRADAELTELREAVDAMSTYESMIEKLTEKNLEYSQKSSQLEVTVRDMEEQQELSEELDQQQRAELDLFRKALDSANIEIVEKESALLSLDAKMTELKKINEKFRRHGEQLKGEMDTLRGQVSLSAVESDRMALRARAAATSHLEVAELKTKISTLSSELNTTSTAVNRWKASHVRMYSIFGRSSLFSTENELCVREVSAVAVAALGSSVAQAILQSAHKKMYDIQLSVAPPAAQSCEDEGNDVNNLKLKNPKDREVDAGAIRRVLVVLRAAAVCWHCAGCVLSEQSDNQNMNESLSSVVTSLHNLFEVVRSVLDEHSEEEQFDDKIFAEIETVAIQAELLLQTHFASLGICTLPPIPSLQPARRGSSLPGEAPVSQNNLENVQNLSGDGDNSNLRRFHLSVQTSYLSISCDLHVAFINSRITSQRSFFSPPFSPTASPLTASSINSDEDFSNTDVSKQPLPSPHTGATSDLCKTIRLEIEALGLFIPGGILQIKSKTLNAPGKVTDNQSNINDTIKSSLLKCSEHLQGIVFPYTVSDELTVSPAQLRACQSNIYDIRGLIVTNQGPESSSSSDQVTVINLVSPVEINMLWHLVLSADNDNDDNSNSNNNSNNNYNGINETNDIKTNNRKNKSNKWDDLAFWKQRSKVHKSQLVAWEKSQTEVGTLKSTLIETQKELKSRVEELRASKSAYQELDNLSQKSSTTNLSTSLNENNEGNAKLISSVNRNNGNNENNENNGKDGNTGNSVGGDDAVKLKAEIEVLTSALKVLEIQFEGAERENKRIRSAGRISDSTVTNPSKVVLTLAEMVRVWRTIASRRLMISMLPLPTNTPHTMKKNMFAATDITSSQESEGPSIQGPSHGIKVHDPSGAVNITAANTYRELRKLRSSVRVPVNSISMGTNSYGNSVGNSAFSVRNDGVSRSLYLGRQNKGEIAELIEKYTQSILVCGGSLTQ